MKKVIDWEKIEKLPTTEKLLDELYGKRGTSTREAFIKEAYAYYNQVIAEADDEEDCQICETERVQTEKQNVLVAEEK